ncbi:MAG: transcription antitermination factor NusB [Bacteroidota bacterium]
MLNRRLLRIKVMQAVFSATQAERALQEVAREQIAARFEHDLNSMVPYNAELEEGHRRLATLIFDENVGNERFTLSEPAPAVVSEAALDAFKYYKVQVAQERERVKQHLPAEAESLAGRYLNLLRMLTWLPRYVREDDEGRANNWVKAEPVPRTELKLMDNYFIIALTESKLLETALTGVSVPEGARDFIRRFYRDVLTADPLYIEYIKTREATREEEYKIMRHIVKNLLFKSEVATDWLEEQDLYWAENKDILQGMVLKTLKDIQEKGNETELLRLSPDWEEDKAFAERLFKETVAGTDYFEKLIVEKSTNWESGRVALTDRVILMMALAEMMNFSSIPVKVSINEYIELSREYSTPDSRRYINGMLDALSKQLIEEGRIKKSGRGLIAG